MSELYGVSIDELLGNEKQPAQTGELDDDKLKAAFFGGYDGLSEQEIDELWADAKNFRDFLIEKKRG